MKQFYECGVRHDRATSSGVKEWVEYDINTLIRNEAEMILECDDSLADISDEEFVVMAKQRAAEIKEELMRNGIYRNEFGQPLFLYC